MLACGDWIPRVGPLEHEGGARPDRLGVGARRRRAARARLRAPLPVRFLDEQAETLALAAPDDLRALVARSPGRLRRVPRRRRTSSPTVRRSGSSTRRAPRQGTAVGGLAGLDVTTDDPARDARYFPSSFYWPDVLDPTYPYGEGIALQMRSAVSHLNEVWAVETAGRILHDLSPELGWEFTRTRPPAGSTTSVATC